MNTRRTAVPPPRWGRLYAILPLAAGAYATLELLPLATPARVLADWGLVLAAAGAMIAWVRSHRTALALADWGPCAPGAVGIRVVSGGGVDGAELPVAGDRWIEGNGAGEREGTAESRTPAPVGASSR